MIKVYYLDDEELLTDLFRDYFDIEGIELRTFINPKEAVQVAKDSPPDIFFIDYRMPGMNGDEVASSLSDTITKILITGDIDKNYKYPFDNVIRKPYKPEEVLEIIDSLKE